ncbi:MAG: hypothetical protein NVS3B27_08610 [Novosphingobium sp.]
MPHAPFVPLRVFSSYTMLDGAVDPKMIARTAADRKFPAIAITDRNGLYGAVAFASAAKAAGVQPIIGTMLGVARPERGGAAPGFGPATTTVDWLALYAQDEAGYDNLCDLVSRAHLDRPLECAPHVALADLVGRTQGLIALTAAGEGALTRLFGEGQQAAGEASAARVQELFPNRLSIALARRGEVIRYVQAKYGHDHVAQIITFGKLKARAVLRDTGRILQMSYGQVDRLCKLVPNHPTDPWTLPRTLNGVAEFKREYDRDEDTKRLIDLAMQLEGLPRNSSTHAAGVVIGDRPLAQLVPLYRDPRSDMPVTQYDMKHVEDSGLVKFDFLGLKTLSVLQKAVQLMEKRGVGIDLSALAWDDEQTYKLLQSGATVGVFQLESEGMRRTLAAVKPTAFGDIIALVSLYRPGPMDNIPLFGRRKNGLESIEYPHPKLEGILAETYGIFVYQEQVMQAAQILAGYSLGDADLLRRAMGKKVQAEMDAQRQRFVDGCKTVSDIPAAKANELFDLIDKFAGYGFNKSHAAAYALLAYQTAWLKTHYPHEFYAASMCFDMHQSEKLAIFVDDMRRYGVALAGPDINHSEAEYTVERTDEGHAVRYALAGLRNVGEKAMDALVAERDAHGPVARREDWFRRLPAGVR